MFFSNGPNSATGTNSVLVMMEHQVQYAVMCAQKLQRERLKSIEPKVEAIADFDKWMQVNSIYLTWLVFSLTGVHSSGLFQEGQLTRDFGNIFTDRW